ncbi:MAG: hypothetical protein CMB78_04710 [Euryarchaeota archaeon]|nr:hypothetical protein [Euryarchaeota archaeon]
MDCNICGFSFESGHFCPACGSEAMTYDIDSDSKISDNEESETKPTASKQNDDSEYGIELPSSNIPNVTVKPLPFGIINAPNYALRSTLPYGIEHAPLHDES